MLFDYAVTKFFMVILVLCAAVAAGTATNFPACLEAIQNNTYGNITGLDTYGHPVANVTLAKGVDYTTCVRVCGSGPEAFNWSIFSPQFNSWLVPWLALVSQLPVGAENRLDNIMSVLFAVGSPALAAYSLVITLLNNRWLERQLEDVRFPNVKRVISVFSALQHIPFQLNIDGPLLPSLVVLPQNDGWWLEMSERSEHTRKWNMPAAINIAWVFIALIFTVADWVDDIKFVDSHGYAVGAVWLWLLPIVVGWLRVGSQTESGHLRRALWYCNSALAHVATEEAPEKAGKFSERRAIAHGLGTKICAIQNDERREAPIFNYARVLFWSQATEYVIGLYRAASIKAQEHLTVDGREWVNLDNAREIIHDANRTGNAERVICYSRHLYTATGEPENLSWLERPALGPRWSPGVFGRMAVAIVAALFLQWCTAGAAMMMSILTPAVGLGCRSVVYLVYGTISTLSLFSFIISGLLAHACRPSGTDDLKGWSTIVETFAIGFRWIGKTLAAINVLVIIVGCILQFANVFSNCYCNSSVTGRGKDKAMELFLTGSDMIEQGIRDVWIGGFVMALIAAMSFGMFIYVASPPRRFSADQ